MRAAFALLAPALSGCIHLSAVTAPPPTRTAHLSERNRKIELSAGAALGFDCRHSTFWTNGPCPNATARTDDPSVARVYPAHLDPQVADFYWRSMTKRVGFIIVGIRPGTTRLRVSADGTEDQYVVTVLD
jgi:hypothetical protein